MSRVPSLYLVLPVVHVRARVNGTGRRVGRDRVRVSNQDVAVTGNAPRKVRQYVVNRE